MKNEKNTEYKLRKRALFPKDTQCSSVSSAALLITANLWKQTRYPTTEQTIRKTRHIYTVGLFYSHRRE